MNRRPNAPFKPPRPFAGVPASNRPLTKTGFSPSKVSSLSPLLDASVTCLDPSDSKLNISNKRAKPMVKRLKVRLIRNLPDDGAQEDASSQSVHCSQETQPSLNKKYYTVQWRKRSNKKNKSWEGDGYIVQSEEGITLKIQKDKSYKPVGRSKNTSVDGVILFGSYEAEVDTEATLEDIKRLTSGTLSPPSSPIKIRTVTVLGNPMKRHKTSAIKEIEPLFIPNDDTSSAAKTIDSPSPEVEEMENLPFTLPCRDGIGHITVDVRLLNKLRQHQKEAVLFIYKCVTGIQNPNHLGVLLADEMGLGKTLTAITITWTLLKHSPDPLEPPPLKKVLICCPVTLIDNWRREFSKWLDVNRIGILALNNKQQLASKDKQDIIAFGRTKVYQVLIMSYEKVMSCIKEIGSVEIDMVICDEGHRLKSAANKTLNALDGFNIPRKLVLTGTPIQNDLNEYYTIINFVNPGILGSFAEFQKEYLKPILKAREKGCILKELLQEGRTKSNELIAITKSFVLRRTKDTIKNFLTDRTDVLIFCKPTKIQKSLFDLAVSSNKFNSVMGTENAVILALINVFRKICNLPSLLTEDSLYQQLYAQSSVQPDELVPSALKKRVAGSKVNVLVPLLLEFKKVREKTVLISNFTQTLDLLELVLSKLNLLFLRLDGATSSSTRDQLVTKFNRGPQIDVFLLSAKAGGVGLNLIGASRLILFDNDWNPLIDQQALARIHRDGQKRPVFIYRLFTAGSIDEKIFQRQLTKITLSDMFLDDHSDSNLNIFDFEDLRDLFTVNDTKCNTHDLLRCDCDGVGETTTEPDDVVDTDLDEESALPSSGFSSALSMMESNDKEFEKRRAFRTALVNFKHFDPEKSCDTGDDILNRLVNRTDGDVTYSLTHTQKSCQP